ncbi:MAG: hypothetical protein ACPGID_00010 [Rubricella sp.]
MRVIAILLALFLGMTTAVSADAPQQSSPAAWAEILATGDVLEQVNHYGSGVMSREFVGMGRCSQVCPIMRDIANAHCSSQGQCWCDERSGGVTIAYLTCG